MPLVKIAGWRWSRHALLFVVLMLAAMTARSDEPFGTLGIVGSDTMAGLMLRWGEQLSERHPGIRLQLQASGSASASTALTAGTTRLGPMSRAMSETERQAFLERHGYAVVELEVARDALAVIVHRHHPLAGLSGKVLDAIFSSTRRCGGATDITHWKQLGIEDVGGRIELHGRNLASGSYGLFRQRALCGGEYRARLNEHPGSAAVVAAVSESREAIGYVGLSHLSPSVKPLVLGEGSGGSAPPVEQMRRSDYPLSRALYLYVNLSPGEAIAGPERALLELILSPEGQQTVAALGFVPLPSDVIEAQRRQLGLDEVAP